MVRVHKERKKNNTTTNDDEQRRGSYGTRLGVSHTLFLHTPQEIPM